MADTLLGALGELMRLQRWNAMPRVEVWNESENIAYTTHIVYAIGKLKGMSNEDLLHGIQRALLKSLNKHLLSDILIGTRDVIRDINKEAWKELIDVAAKETAKLFPRRLLNYAHSYMTYDGDYVINNDNVNKKKGEIENLIKYVQFKVAANECDINSKVYDQSYAKIRKTLSDKLAGLPNLAELDRHYMELGEHPLKIENLKNLRRWNRVNRSVETTVLGHTFIVALLTFVIAHLCNDEIQDKDFSHAEYIYAAIVRALFHDVPETFTGDIISPVKAIINKHDSGLLQQVEEKMLSNFKNDMPTQIHKDIEHYHLLDELSDSQPYTISSLVKACDSTAIVLECLFERETGSVGAEMTSAYINYVSRLQNSK